MSGLSSPAAAKMSMTPSDTTAREMIWRMAKSSSSSGRVSAAARLESAARTAWKKATSSRMRVVSGWGTDRVKAWDSSRTALRQRSLPSCWARICSWAAGSRFKRCWVVPVSRRSSRSRAAVHGRRRTSPA